MVVYGFPGGVFSDAWLSMVFLAVFSLMHGSLCFLFSGGIFSDAWLFIYST